MAALWRVELFVLFFDESKPSPEKALYVLGGYAMPLDRFETLEDLVSTCADDFFGNSDLNPDTEFHAAHLLHGKANFKGVPFPDRVELLRRLLGCLATIQAEVLVTRVDVLAHKTKYRDPMETADLAAKLLFEDYQEFLKTKGAMGWAYGDRDGKQSDKTEANFSRYKGSGTPFVGKSISRINTIAFLNSRYSRHLQIADIISYLSFRYSDSATVSKNYIDEKCLDLWQDFLSTVPSRVYTWAPGRQINGLHIVG